MVYCGICEFGHCVIGSVDVVLSNEDDVGTDCRLNIEINYPYEVECR